VWRAAHSQPSSAPLDIYDGIETPALSDFWETLPFAPGSAAIQSSIVRAGNSALRIPLKPHDLFEAGSNGNQDNERDETLENSG